ncbi:hypothetical protein ACED46_21355, partial [Vibrio sp. 1S139]
MKKHLISALIIGSLMSTNAFAELNKEQTQQLEEINQFLKENPSTISGLHTSLERRCCLNQLNLFRVLRSDP